MRAHAIILSFVLGLVLTAAEGVAAPAGILEKEDIFLTQQAEEIIFNKEILVKILSEKRPTRFLLGRSRQLRNVEAWFFPGSTANNALVIGGVHGSELSSIAITSALIRQLQQGKTPFYNVIIIPALFPDNMQQAINNPLQIGSVSNIGRYSLANAVDPNRQMPSPGKAFDERTGLDHLGRKIEPENQLLLQLIQSYRPQRIINIHAIKNTARAGVFADPRTDHRGFALGYASDSSLAISMANYIDEQGGHVPGNYSNTKPSALYYKDPVPVPAGFFQKRNMTGSALTANRGSGVSLGTWASTAVLDEANPSANRDAMRILTMEYPGCKRPEDYTSPAEQAFHERQVELFAYSVSNIFLGEYWTEKGS